MTRMPLDPKSRSLWPWVYVVSGLLVVGVTMSRTHTKSAAAAGPVIGDIVTVHPGTWVCASSEDALDEISQQVARHDTDEMRRTIARTRSFILDAGARLKILDSTLMTRKVRVLDSGRECWVPMEAVAQP